MKVLLDFDGVLITTPVWRAVEQHPDGFLKFDSRAEKNLIRLVSETNATIVLTTTHRIAYSNEKWKEIFNNRGIPVEVIEKVNAKLTLSEMKDRGKEIKEWIDHFGVNQNFVIIDDDLSINALSPEIKRKWVMTKSMIGLDESCTEEAMEILRGN